MHNAKLLGQLVPVADITARERASMYELMARHYEGVSLDDFARDLAEKEWVVLLIGERDRQIRGFSTQMVIEATVYERPAYALFSGDTIVDREFWGDPSLFRASGELALSLISRYEGHALYWFLISQGFRTYRLLPAFFHDFYPRYDRPESSSLRTARDTFARQKYPHHYDPAAGVIRADQYRLREGIADITEERVKDPHIQFFAAANPGHVVGNELCCIAPLTRDNFTAIANRLLGSRYREPAVADAAR